MRRFMCLQKNNTGGDYSKTNSFNNFKFVKFSHIKHLENHNQNRLKFCLKSVSSRRYE